MHCFSEREIFEHICDDGAQQILLLGYGLYQGLFECLLERIFGKGSFGHGKQVDVEDDVFQRRVRQ